MSQKADDNAASMPKLDQLEAELEREKYRSRYRNTLKSTVVALIITAAVVVLLTFLLFPIFRIYGNSMVPTVKEDEIVVTMKASDFACGDIVVLSYNNKLLVKRVLAGPGDWFDMDREGNVYVNGEYVDEPYLPEKAFGDCDLALPYQVPEGRFFVMGDNRATSQDSRSSLVGCIAEEQIIGRAILRLWPLREFGIINQ